MRIALTWTLLALGIVLVATTVIAPRALAASPRQIIAILNAERTANGIPAGIVENPEWSADCALHNHYERVNHLFGHSETPGTPGYTPEGNLAATSSVLAEGIQWGPRDPYENAPYHLFDLLSPQLSVTGAADSEGFGCVDVLLGRERPEPAQPIGYSYPGNGRTGVPVSQRAEELPQSPAETLGLGSRLTGPNLFVYFDGPWASTSVAKVTAAAIAGPHGAVSLRSLDNTGSDLLPSPGAIVIPDSPLKAGRKYRVTVQATISGVSLQAPVPIAFTAPTCQTEANGSIACIPGAAPSISCGEASPGAPPVCGETQTWTTAYSFSFKTAVAHHPARRRSH